MENKKYCLVYKKVAYHSW